MTERGRGAVGRDATTLAIGPSAMRWEGDALVIDLAETAVPHLSPIRGRVRVIPQAFTEVAYRLDGATENGAQGADAGADARADAGPGAGAAPWRMAALPAARAVAAGGAVHVWRPFSPAARVEVALDRPGISWSGRGYFDGNFGPCPLEADFRSWTWQRASLGDGASVFFDAECRDGGAGTLGLRFRADGGVDEVEPLPRAPLPRTLWRIARAARADAGTRPAVLHRMEDAPFYARSALRARLWGEEAEGVHEILDCDRLEAPWCRLMLPFRMPRRARWRD